MAGIYTSPYPIEKFGDSPYPHLYRVNARIPHQNGDGFGQYPRGRVYLPSLLIRSFLMVYREKDLVTKDKTQSLL